MRTWSRRTLIVLCLLAFALVSYYFPCSNSVFLLHHSFLCRAPMHSHRAVVVCSASAYLRCTWLNIYRRFSFCVLLTMLITFLPFAVPHLTILRSCLRYVFVQPPLGYLHHAELCMTRVRAFSLPSRCMTYPSQLWHIWSLPLPYTCLTMLFVGLLPHELCGHVHSIFVPLFRLSCASPHHLDRLRSCPNTKFVLQVASYWIPYRLSAIFFRCGRNGRFLTLALFGRHLPLLTFFFFCLV